MTSITSSIRSYSAFAFDFDGTLVDTMEFHFEAYKQVFEEMGVLLSRDDFFDNIGGKATETIPLFLRGRRSQLSVQEIHARKKSLVMEMFRTIAVPVLPTARLLPMLAPSVPLALVSSGSRAGIELLLERLGWSPWFSVIVTGDDTLRSKPDPMPYEIAAAKLKLPPQDILAFEDTDAGFESAQRAGMPVFMVKGNLPFLIS